MKKRAVVLKYEKEKDVAPRVIAKGGEAIAEKIIEIAREHDVPLYENQGLLQQLYSLEVGEYIPEQFYQVVAALLAWVYSLDRKEAR